MKKLIGKWWAKAIAVLLCVVSVFTGAVSLAAMIYESESPQGELLDTVYEQIAYNYSAKALSDYKRSADSADFLEKVKSDIDPQLRFAIVKKTGWSYKSNPQALAIEIGAYDEDAEYLYGDASVVEKASYWMLGGEAYSYYYSTSSLLAMLQSGYSVMSYANNAESMVYESVNCVVYDAASGLFYYEAESGYYPVHSIVVTDNEDVVTYTLTEQSSVEEAAFEETDGENTAPTSAVLGYVDVDDDTVQLPALAPGSLVQMENSTCAMRVLTKDADLVAEDSGSYVLYTDNLLSRTASDIYGLENTYVEDGLLVIVEEEDTEEEYYYVFSYVDDTVSNDAFPGFFTEAALWVERWESIVSAAIPLEIFSVLLFFAALFFLIYSAGHHEKDGEDEIRLSVPDTVWLEAVLLAAGLAASGIVALMFVLLDEGPLTVAGLLTVEMELGTALILLAVFCLMTVAARIKTRKLWRYTVSYWCVRACVRIVRAAAAIAKKLWANIPARFFWWIMEKRRERREFARTHETLMRRSIVLLIGVSLILFGTFALCCLTVQGYYGGGAIVWIIALIAVVWIFTMALVTQLVRLKEGGVRLAEGDLSCPIDTNGLFWEFKLHAENINKAGDGIAAAVEDRMKSEHFKTELITNVSHDIKTPLTSIINYVDLIQKEEIKNETIREYIAVLARQSSRLKKLIEDLIEASKASTGNLPVHLETCDARVLLTQIVGEFEEKAAACDLTLIEAHPKEAVMVRVDSRHIWRVFDNLLTNIIKYAQPGTRVYIALTREGDEAVVSFKNISRYPLNITSEELMERFVRGDSSRSTEGSGLGLSIAESLASLMGGSMALFVDGDLFKVVLRFPVVG